MKRKIVAIFITCLLIMTSVMLTACKKDDTTITEEELTVAAQLFIDQVNGLGEITLESIESLNRASLIYNNLSVDDREFKTVITAKTQLDQKRAQYEILAEAEDEDNNKEEENKKIIAFLDSVALIPKLDTITETDKAKINYAVMLYNELREKSKTMTNVVEGYIKLSQAKTKIDEFTAQDDITAFELALNSLPNPITADNGAEIESIKRKYAELSETAKKFESFAAVEVKYQAVCADYENKKNEKDVNAFLSLVNDLGTITLSSENSIKYAETAYRILSEYALNMNGVSQAKIKLDTARQTFNALYLDDQVLKRASFINKVEKLPTQEELDKTWYLAIQEVGDFYKLLSADSKAYPEIVTAYNSYLVIKEIFDEFGFQQLKITTPTIVFSADTIPFLVIQNSESVVPSILKVYNVEQLSQTTGKLKMCLYVYVDGKTGADYAGKVDIEYTSLANNGRIMYHTAVISALKTISQTNTEVKSGGTFSFAINFEDLTGEYLPSAFSSNTKNTSKYTW